VGQKSVVLEKHEPLENRTEKSAGCAAWWRRFLEKASSQPNTSRCAEKTFPKGPAKPLVSWDIPWEIGLCRNHILCAKSGADEAFISVPVRAVRGSRAWWKNWPFHLPGVTGVLRSFLHKKL
jgi:hypothetical protein